MDNIQLKKTNASLEKEADIISSNLKIVAIILAIIMAIYPSLDVTEKLASEFSQMTYWEGVATFLISWVIITLMIIVFLVLFKILYHSISASILGIRLSKHSSKVGSVKHVKLDEECKTGELIEGIFYSNKIDVDNFNEFLEGNKDFLYNGENLCLLYFVLLDKECIKKNNSAFREYIGARIECVKISAFNTIFKNLNDKLKGDALDQNLLEKSENMLLNLQSVIKGK